MGTLAGGVTRRPSMAGTVGADRSGVVRALLPVVLGMLADRRGAAVPDLGGLDGLLEQLTRIGYGRQARSWVGTGANEPVPADAWTDVFGREQLAAIASQAGVGEDEAGAALSALLPRVVDGLTPEGKVPAARDLRARIDAYAARLRG